MSEAHTDLAGIKIRTIISEATGVVREHSMSRYTASQIKNCDCETLKSDGKRWIPAKPYNGADRLRDRITDAWGVLTGRFDALDWEDRNENK